MANKHGKVVTHREGEFLNMLSRKITLPIQDISPLSQSFDYKTYECGDIPQGAPYEKTYEKTTMKRLMASKPSRVLTYGRRFSTQTLKSSPTSCFFSSALPSH